MNFTRPTHWWRELPKELDVYNVTHWTVYFASRVDTRTNGWPLMDDFSLTLYACVAYIALILLGPAVVGKLLREPLNVKWAMIVYDVFVIGLNLGLFVGFAWLVVTRGYNFVCNAVDYTDDLAVKLVYGYYVSKGVDFTDTVFMLLRKKFDQASFLHVYHHCSMFLIWYIAARYLGGGVSVVGPLCNTFVHVLMYSYYLAIALKVRVPGVLKRSMTRLQIFQLLFVMVYSIVVAQADCPFPSVVLYAQGIFLGTLAVLFVQYYNKVYADSKAKAALTATSDAATAAASPVAKARGSKKE